MTTIADLYEEISALRTVRDQQAREIATLREQLTTARKDLAVRPATEYANGRRHEREQAQKQVDAADLLRRQAEAEAVQLRGDLDLAERTLTGAGWSAVVGCAGRTWKPPLGAKPEWLRMEQLQAELAAALERAEKAEAMHRECARLAAGDRIDLTKERDADHARVAELDALLSTAREIIKTARCYCAAEESKWNAVVEHWMGQVAAGLQKPPTCTPPDPPPTPPTIIEWDDGKPKDYLVSVPPRRQVVDPRAEIVKALMLGLTIDGGHHKQWALDQALRKLVTDDWYAAAWAEFGWDQGIPP